MGSGRMEKLTGSLGTCTPCSSILARQAGIAGQARTMEVVVGQVHHLQSAPSTGTVPVGQGAGQLVVGQVEHTQAGEGGPVGPAVGEATREPVALEVQADQALRKAQLARQIAGHLAVGQVAAGHSGTQGEKGSQACLLEDRQRQQYGTLY